MSARHSILKRKRSPSSPTRRPPDTIIEMKQMLKQEFIPLLDQIYNTKTKINKYIEDIQKINENDNIIFKDLSTILNNSDDINKLNYDVFLTKNNDKRINIKANIDNLTKILKDHFNNEARLLNEFKNNIVTLYNPKGSDDVENILKLKQYAMNIYNEVKNGVHLSYEDKRKRKSFKIEKGMSEEEITKRTSERDKYRDNLNKIFEDSLKSNLPLSSINNRQNINITDIPRSRVFSRDHAPNQYNYETGGRKNKKSVSKPKTSKKNK